MDDVVVGAGLSGAVMAERLAVAGRRVLLLEQRDHVAGNCHDEANDAGVYLHRYGPHIFHTDRQMVWQYLSRFTDWLPYEHRVLACIEGKRVPLPFNLNTLEQLFPAERAAALERALIGRLGEGAQVPILELRATDDPALKALAEYVYANVFRGYSRKQWGVDPDRLAPEVTGRVPVRISRDDRYFLDPYQGIPREGYTRMVERMLDHPRIALCLNTPMAERLRVDGECERVLFDGRPFAGRVIYTGMIDALFDYRFGRLPYRSLRFELEAVSGPWQPVATVNYPNDHDFTRITEFGHFVGRADGPDVIMREYPKAYDGEREGEGMPYYPLFTAENQRLFERYRAYAERVPGLVILGRLAEYKYFDMDDAVARALDCFARIEGG
ncbi:UDP-galactopyranose mutase [Endothiovibrio diazotrophicus]